MAYSIILKATASIVVDAKIEALDAFVKYMQDKIEIDDEINEWVRAFKSTIVADDVEISKPRMTPGEKAAAKASGEPTKRAPLAYNIFVKETIAELGKGTMSKKDVLVEARRLWAKKKAVEEANKPAKKPKKSKKAVATESDDASDVSTVEDEVVDATIAEALEKRKRVSKAATAMETESDA